MLFTYNKDSKLISPLSETNFRKHRIMERQDIESWVEKHPELLGEDLLILTTEYDRFDKTDERLDLLALDKEGNLVVIELKRDDSGSTVDLQAIKYASYVSTLTLSEVEKIYCSFTKKSKPDLTLDQAREDILNFIDNEEFEEINDKPRIVIISRDFRPEVTATVLWLRKFGVNIKCVKLTPYDFSDNLIALESSVIIPLPEAEDYIIKSEQKENSEGSLTVTQEEYLRLFKELSYKLSKLLPISFREPRPIPYYQILTSIGSTHFEWTFHGRPRSSLGVEIHFEKGDKQKNSAVMNKLLPHISTFNEKYQIHLEYQLDWGKSGCRIFIERNEGKASEELKEWAVDTMYKMYSHFNPIIEQISKEI